MPLTARNEVLLDAPRGSIVTMLNGQQVLLPPSTDGCLLTTDANNANGVGLVWTADPEVENLTVDNEFTLNGAVIGTAIFNGRIIAEGTPVSMTCIGLVQCEAGISAFSATPPASQPAYPGTGVDNNADTINAIVALLSSYGLCAPFPATTATLSGGATTGAATVQIITPFTITLSLAAPAGGVKVTPAGTLSGDTFQAASGGANVSTVTVAEGATTTNFYYTPGADGTGYVSFTSFPVTTYAGTPKTVTVSG